MGLLTLTLVLPAAGAVLLAVLAPGDRTTQVVGLVASGATFVASLLILTQFDAAAGTLQLDERVAWIPGRGATSFVDGGLRPGRTHVYIVRATAGTRASPLSAEAEVRTPFACLW
jgi:hypothetical protein